MSNKFSFITCCIISIILLSYRIIYSDLNTTKPLRVTTWDALGYYMYLPAIFIYKDVQKLNWLPEIDKKYAVSGGYVYQAYPCHNGNYFFKYLGGVAILELPFFFLAHLITEFTDYLKDGFSPPYQFAVAFGVVLYCIGAVFLFRKVLLTFFNDTVTAITLLWALLATNFIQYVSVNSGMSHGYIFPLYVLVLYLTIKWHEKPKIIYALLLGYIVGLSTICRPTEAIMLFIPLLWNTTSKENSTKKWNYIKKNMSHVFLFIVAGFVGILPQLFYWKFTTGSYIFDVGSKWDFLSPHFQVLWGWNKGWFIYTPVTIFFIVGFFFLKEFPFKYAVMIFCIINIFLIISWSDWRYGGSYSARALVQSYPVFALGLGAFIYKFQKTRWKYVFGIIGFYLISVNLFQIWQYNRTILHYYDMNRPYYGRIYLNPSPTLLDMSLLDSNVWINERNFIKEDLFIKDTSINVYRKSSSLNNFINIPLKSIFNNDKTPYIKIECAIKLNRGFSNSFLRAEIFNRDIYSIKKVRLFNALTKSGTTNYYAFYVEVPAGAGTYNLRLSTIDCWGIDGQVKRIVVKGFRKVH